MAKIIETAVYHFDELSDEAKEKARQWYAENDDFSIYAENVIDDAKEVAARIGIEIKNVYYSGFSSQGDGACFEGHYEYKKNAHNAIKEYAPEDTELHRIASELQKLQRRRFYKLMADVKHSGHYYHAYCTKIEIFDYCQAGGWPSSGDGTEDALKELMRDFMRWIYARLAREYEYQNSVEQIDESIIANEYTFTKQGKRFG